MTLRLLHGRARHSVRAVLRQTQPLRGLRRAEDCAPYLIALLLLTAGMARAQTAEEFFNGGAQFYISNNVASAWQKVESGRKLYPDDVKLKKLEELLKQQSQQQQQQQQSQQNQQNQQNPSNQQQEQKQQEQKNQQSQQQNSGGQQNQPQQNQQQQNQADQQKDQSQPGQQPQPTNGRKDDKSEEQGGQPQASANREMSPEEARRLLDAQKGDEQILQFKPAGPPKSQNKPIKDW